MVPFVRKGVGGRARGLRSVAEDKWGEKTHRGTEIQGGTGGVREGRGKAIILWNPGVSWVWKTIPGKKERKSRGEVDNVPGEDQRYVKALKEKISLTLTTRGKKGKRTGQKKREVLGTVE